MAIYVYTDQRDGGVAHIPSSNEFSDLKSIMDGLSLTTADDYKVKLHMPFAGYRSYNTSSRADQGIDCACWSSSPVDSERAYFLNFGASSLSPTRKGYRALGASVRLFCDTYIEPDNTRAVETGTLGSAGIFHNADLGVISVTNGSDKNITMYDKNVGATVVYNSGDTLSESNCGKLFQRGNYYGFPFTGTVTKSSTTVDTTGYGGSNPYSSSTFITGNDRSNPQNDNLRTDSGENYFVIE